MIKLRNNSIMYRPIGFLQKSISSEILATKILPSILSQSLRIFEIAHVVITLNISF